MKISSLIRFHTIGIRYNFIIFLCLFFVGNCLFALEPTTSEESDPDMNLYSKARKQEEDMGRQYMNDSIKGFSKKLDRAIKKDEQLSKFFGKGYCDGCDSVVSPDFDDALIEYFRGIPPLTKNIAYDYLSVIRPHLDSHIVKMTIGESRALNTLINIMIDSIMGQVKEQMILSRDIAPMGQYYDGDTDNSPYDLRNDMALLDAKFFDKTPEGGSYHNTSADMAGLISGKKSPTGEWGIATVARDVANALGESLPSPSRLLVGADTCGPRGCSSSIVKSNTHTVQFLRGNSYDFKPEGSGNTLESIFGKGTDFMKKFAENRNNACKIAPTWFFFQGLFDQNASLAEMFSMGIHPVQEVPELLKGFMNRKTRTPESEDKEIDDSTAKAFKSRGMNIQKPTEILVAGIERSINKVSRENSDGYLPVSASVDALKHGENEYKKYITSVGKGMEGVFIKKHSIESMEHLGVAFEEVKSRSRSMNSFSQTINTITDYLLSKGECQPS